MQEVETQIEQQNVTWNKEQLLYMSILSDPTETRMDEEIAEFIGVDRVTLWRWRQLEGFSEEAYNILIKNLSGKLGKVFAGLIKRANQGDASSARLILEAIGKLKVQGTKEGDKNLIMNFTFSEEQLEKDMKEYCLENKEKVMFWLKEE